MPLSDPHFSESELGKIFSFESPTSDRLISRENSRLEFKETFNLGSADEYAKTAKQRQHSPMHRAATLSLE